MTGFSAVFFRELRSATVTLASWTALAVGTVLLSIVFMLLVMVSEGPVTLQPVMGIAAWVLLIVVPALAMRSFSDERRQGTWEILQSAPVRPGGIVLGKFAAIFFQLVLLCVPILLLGGVLEFYGRPDWGEILCGVLGLLLAGSCWLALGMLASTASDSQLVSYLLAVFCSLALVLLTRLLPSVVPADWASMLFAIDPTRRTDAFAIGLLDTANVVYFLSAISGLLWLTTLAAGRRFGTAVTPGRFLRTGLETAGILVSMAAFVALFDLPDLRRSYDLTRTRAYALDDSTVELLQDLPGGEGAWSIHLLAVESENDSVVLRQVDEVLDRFQEASPGLVAERIDPLDPESLESFEELLTRLRSVYQDEVITYEEAIGEARRSYQSLVDFAIETLPGIRGLMATLPPEDPVLAEVTELARALTRLPSDSGELEAFIESGLRSDGARPVPDHEGVRAALRTTLEFWSDQLAATGRLLQKWMTTTELSTPVRVWAKDTAPGFAVIAARLAASADRLDRLAPLALSEASRAIQAGEAAIIIAPESGAAVVPSWQLFPRKALDADDGTVRLDRRFRGEEVLAGAIRSLLMDERPWVVFVHAEDRRLMQPTTNGNDVFALADALRAARFEVTEWNVSAGDRPIPPAGVRPVWVVVPPLAREGLEISDSENALLEAVGELIGDGEPILLSLSRSILPVLGREDPWVDVARSLGVEPETSRIVLELVPSEDGSLAPQSWQKLSAPAEGADHPLTDAVGTQTLMLLEPLGLGTDAAEHVRTLWEIEPSSTRWLEQDWRPEVIARRSESIDELRFEEPLPVVMAVEYERTDDRRQRAIVVGGAGWLVSTVADLSRSLGGERSVLEAPGNRALMLSATAWLASMDELVPSSGSISATSRIEGLDPFMRTIWAVLLIGMLPAGLFIAGNVIVFTRRRG